MSDHQESSTEVDLSEAEFQAVTIAGNEKAFLLSSISERRMNLSKELAQIEQLVSRSQGKFEGCLQAILNLRGLTGLWNLDAERRKLVRYVQP